MNDQTFKVNDKVILKSTLMIGFEDGSTGTIKQIDSMGYYYVQFDDNRSLCAWFPVEKLQKMESK